MFTFKWCSVIVFSYFLLLIFVIQLLTAPAPMCHLEYGVTSAYCLYLNWLIPSFLNCQSVHQYFPVRTQLNFSTALCRVAAKFAIKKFQQELTFWSHTNDGILIFVHYRCFAVFITSKIYLFNRSILQIIIWWKPQLHTSITAIQLLNLNLLH